MVDEALPIINVPEPLVEEILLILRMKSEKCVKVCMQNDQCVRVIWIGKAVLKLKERCAPHAGRLEYTAFIACIDMHIADFGAVRPCNDDVLIQLILYVPESSIIRVA